MIKWMEGDMDGCKDDLCSCAMGGAHHVPVAGQGEKRLIDCGIKQNTEKHPAS